MLGHGPVEDTHRQLWLAKASAAHGTCHLVGAMAQVSWHWTLNLVLFQGSFFGVFNIFQDQNLVVQHLVVQHEF